MDPTQTVKHVLLVDGKNCVYRAIHANQGDHQSSKTHSLVVMLRFMVTWIKKFTPAAVHVFWDSPKSTLWRRRILDTYKDRDAIKNTGRDIGNELIAVQKAARALFAHMNVRQYYQDTMEADDLIYAYCRSFPEQDIIVVSSDSDFRQLPHHFNHVQVYEPKKGEIVEKPLANPAIQKALMGDNTDKVVGYEGIGPVKSAAMCLDKALLHEFLDKNGDTTYKTNRYLVDLSLCPYNLPNMMYVERTSLTPTKFDQKAILQTASEHGVQLINEYGRICVPFKDLGEQTSNS